MPRYTIESGSFALVGGTPKTALQLVTGTTRRARLVELGISFNSTNAAHVPGLIELREQSTAGTSSAFTPDPEDPAETAAICTARNAFTVEPTDVGLMYPGPWQLTPVGGLFVYQFTDRKFVAISKRVGVRMSYADSQNVGRCWLTFEE